MAISKKQKIRNLKNWPIWPRVAGLIILLAIIIFTNTAITSLFLRATFTNKVQICVSNTNRVIDVVNELYKKNDAELRRRCNDIEKVLPEVESICFVSDKDEVIGKINPDQPNFQYEFNLPYSVINKRVVLSREVMQFVDQWNHDWEANHGTKNHSDEFIDESEDLIREFLRKEIRSNIFKKGNVSPDVLERHVISLKFWLIDKTNVPDVNVCVKNRITIKVGDVIFFAASFFVNILVSVLLGFYFIFMFVNIFKQRKHISRILYTDVTTSGNNAIYFEKEAEKKLKKVKRGKANYFLANIHIDKLSTHTACFGQEFVDSTIEKIYKTIEKEIGKGEILARYDSSDFVVFMNFTDRENATARVSKIVSDIQALNPANKIKCSVGLCQVDPDADNINEIYNNAILARTLSVTETNKLVWFEQEMCQVHLWEHQVENDMDRAIEQEEFLVYLQPKYGVKNEKLSAAEALVRWQHPTEGFVPPNKFIPILEKNGMIIKLDDYMISHVAKLQAKWMNEGKQVVPVSVNVSRAHFTIDNLAQHIADLVDEHKVPHEFIEIELTESAFFDDKEVLLNTVDELHKLGFKVSMDDFGAGYSSLNTLKELPLDVIKIDAEFFRGKDNLERGQLIVGQTIQMAKNLKMEIVAEGIETRDQVDFLKTQGCDLIQGYYFSKPIPVDEFEKSL